MLVLPGVFHGLPQILDPDEIIFVRAAFKMMVSPYLDPEWYGAPASTLIDVLTPIYGIWLAVLKATGSIESAWVSLVRDTHVYVLIGRIVTAASMLLAAGVLFVSCRRTMGPFPAFVAAATFLCAPGIVHYAQVTRMDLPMILFVLLVLHLSARIVEVPTVANFLLAGAALGAAVVSKYPGVIAALAIVAAALLAWHRGQASPDALARRIALAATASVATAFVLAPFLFFHFGEVLADVLHEARGTHLSATAEGFVDNILFYVGLGTGGHWEGAAFLEGSGVIELAGVVPAVAALAGFVLLLARSPRSPMILYPLFGIAFVLFISSLPLRWTRWALPLVPVVAVGGGILAHGMLGRIAAKRRWMRLLAGGLVLAVIVGPPAALSARTTALKALDRDTRIAATAWLREHVPPGTPIAVETYAPQISVEHFDVLVPADGKLKPLREAWPRRLMPPPFYGSFGALLRGRDVEAAFAAADVVVLSNWEDRYRAEAAAYPEEHRMYQDLRQAFPVVRRFTPGPFMLGPNVTVLGRRAADAPAS